MQILGEEKRGKGGAHRAPAAKASGERESNGTFFTDLARNNRSARTEFQRWGRRSRDF
jgi:hypothetical protein